MHTSTDASDNRIEAASWVTHPYPFVPMSLARPAKYSLLTTTRPYKSAATAEQAYGELMDEVERGWRRRDLVEAFIALKMDVPSAGGRRL